MNPIKGKTFIVCIPGRSFSRDFMLNLIDLLVFISKNGGIFKLSIQYYPMVNAARCLCLGADVTKGKNQTPFGGEIKYDYLLWIDSDIIFDNNSFLQLLQVDQDIVSGWYCQPSLNSQGENLTPVTEIADDNFFNEHGTYKFMTSADIKQKSNPFQVDYIGFGWVLIKKGVFEKLTYPWFAPRLRVLENGMQDLCSEDVAFCIDAKNAGFKIWLDPECRVGHEKILVI